MSVEYSPWEEYPHIWDTEAKFLAFIRGSIRRYAWSKNPIKLEFEKENRVQIPNDNPRSKKRWPTVAGYRCAICNGLYKGNEVQCDHKTGEVPLRSLDDIAGFVKGIVLIKKDDLQMLCKPCHGIKTYADREGLSFEDATTYKKAIDLEKKGTKKVVDFLRKVGYTQPGKNKDARRIQLIEHFKGETR